MLRGPGRRRPVGRGGATPRGRNSGGGVQPADPERVQEMMEARVTEVVDPASFWAQVGDAKALAEFDVAMSSLSRWCDQWAEPASHLPAVGAIVSVKEAESGVWRRAKVLGQASESHVEVFFIDTGATGRVALNRVCGGSSPQLYSLPKQAFKCSLYGIQPISASEVWSEAAVARFTELVTGGHTKTKLVQLVGQGHMCTLQLYTRQGGQWMNVADILVSEGLAARQKTKDHAPAPVTPPLTSEEEEEEEEGEGEGEGDTTLPTDIEKGSSDGSGSGAVGEKGEKKNSEKEGDNGMKKAEEAVLPTLKTPAQFGPLVVKGSTEEEESDSPADSDDDEWDDSLLEPLKDGFFDTPLDPFATPNPDPHLDPFTTPNPDPHSDPSATPNPDPCSNPSATPNPDPHSDPFAIADADPHSLQRRAHLEAQFTAIVGGGILNRDDEPHSKFSPDRRGRGGRLTRRGHYPSHRGGGGWGGDGHAGREGGTWRRGSWRGTGRPRRGGGGGRGGRFDHRSDLDPGGSGRVEVEVDHQPGGMKGVKVTTRQPPVPGPAPGQVLTPGPVVVGNGEMTSSPAKERQVASIPTPPPTRPVELFPRGSSRGAVGGSGGGGGEGQGVAYPLGMSAEMAVKEVQWHRWKLESQVKKLLETLTPESVDGFCHKIQTLLSTHSSALKLRSLPDSHGPVWPILSYLLAEGVKRKDGSEKTIVIAFRKLADLMRVDVCHLLQPVVEEMAIDVCEPSSSEQSVQTKRLFCSFIGKLFLAASYSQNKDYAAVMGHVVRHFLDTWSTCPADCREEQLLARVQCFGYLSEQIGPTIDRTNRETLEEYFTGVVRRHVLNTQLPRSVCGSLLDLSLKRAAGWREEGVSEVAQPASLALSRDTHTHSVNGQQVVSLVPVEPSPQGSGVYQPHPIPHSSVPVSQPVPQTSVSTLQPVPQTSVSALQPVPQTSVPVPQFQTSYPQSEQNVTSPPFHAQAMPIGVQPLLQTTPTGIHPLPQTTPTGIQPLFQTTPTSAHLTTQFHLSFSAVQEMLLALGLSHHVNNFKRTMISDDVLECDNPDNLRGALKDAGLQPGEVVRVLHYLEKRRNFLAPLSSSYTTQHTVNYDGSLGTTPDSPGTPHLTTPQLPPPSPQLYPAPLPPTPTIPQSQPPPQPYTVPLSTNHQHHYTAPLHTDHHPPTPTNHPPTPTNLHPHHYTAPHRPPTPTNHPPTPTNLHPHHYTAPHRPPTPTNHPPTPTNLHPHHYTTPDHHPSTPTNPYPPTPTNPYPPTPTNHHPHPHTAPLPTDHHPPTPTSPYPPTPTNHPPTMSPHPSPLPSYHAVRPPTPALNQPQPPASPTPAAGVKPAPNQKYGFGQFSCVLCRSMDHRTELCPDRQTLLFTHY